MIDPEHTLARLESGWALYREYFVWKWRRSLRRKRQAWPDVYHYLRGYALVGHALEPLAALRDARVRIIAADDDPIIPAPDLERIARSPVLTITRTRYGGHCGFYDGVVGSTWVERQVLASFDAG